MSEYYSDYTSDDDNGSDNDLILTIDLNTTAADQIVHAAKRTTTSNFQSKLKGQQQSLDIVASTILSGVENDLSLRVIKTSKPLRGEAEAREHWVHFQTDSISFEDFERLAINTTLQYHEDLIPVVIYLLRKIQETHESGSAYGSYIEPGTVLRSDGTDRSHRGQPDLSATFISFPYLDVGKWRPPDPPEDESMHLPRGLFQSSYTQDNALSRDGEQMFRKFRGIKADQFLRVPQLWVLILQSKTIITCGPSTLADMFAEYIEFVEEETLLAHGPSLVQVTDFLRRVSYLPVERCRTFLSLKQSIEEQCLSDSEYRIGDCILHSGGSDEELNGNQWPDLLNATSVFVHVRISRKKDSSSGSGLDDALAVEAPDETRLIEYAGLSSDESGDERDRMALTIVQDRTGGESDYSRAAEVTRKRLDDAGYVVNRPSSLERAVDSIPSGETPKIFRRPTQEEASRWDRKTALVLHSSAIQQSGAMRGIPESPTTVSDKSERVLADDHGSETTVDDEDIYRTQRGEMRGAFGGVGGSRSNSAGSVGSDEEDGQASRRSSAHEDRRSNPSTVSFGHDRAPRRELSDHRYRRSDHSPVFFEERRVLQDKISGSGDEQASTRSFGRGDHEENPSLTSLGLDRAPHHEAFDIEDRWPSGKSSGHEDKRSNPSTASFERNQAPEPGSSDMEDGERTKRSSGDEYRRRGLSVVSFESDQAPQDGSTGLEGGRGSKGSSEIENTEDDHSAASLKQDREQKDESRTSEAMYSASRVTKAQKVDMTDERLQLSNSDPSSVGSSPGRPVSERVTRAGRMQPTAESEDEESDPEPPASRPEADGSTHSQAENLEAGTDPGRTDESLPRKGTTGSNSTEPSEKGETAEGNPIGLAELRDDLKRTIEKEVQKKSRKDFDDEFEQRLEDTMRKRLVQFGFQDNQIHAMINPEKVATMPQGTVPPTILPTRQPTYPKTHKNYLDVETLEYYGLPWEWDRQDPNYIVILRELDSRELELLFEHTHRLRQRKTSGGNLIIEERRDKSAPVYRGRERTRSEIPIETHRRGERVSDGSYVYVDVPHRREADVRDASPPPIIKDLNVNLQVPPFLTWSTNLEEDVKNDMKEGVEASNEHDDALTQLTLSAITKHIQKTKQDKSKLPVSFHHPFLNSYKSGKAFVDVPERTFHEVELNEPPRAVPAAQNQSSATLIGIQDELEFLKRLREGTHKDIKSEPSLATRQTSSTKGKAKMLTNLPTRRVMQWQMAKLRTNQESLVSSAQQLIDQFVLKHYPHPLLRKCWGALDGINKVIAEMCLENEQLRMQEANNSFSLIYVVRDVPDKDYQVMHQLEDFAIPVERCATCSKSTLYPDIDDAYQHLRNFHAQKTGTVALKDEKSKLGHWLVSTAGVELERRNTEMLNLIHVILRRTEKLLLRAMEIRTSVANDKNQKSSEYLLPSALVRAAEKIFQFIYTARYTVQYLRDQHVKLTIPTGLSSIEVQDNISLAEYFGIAADNDLSKAQNELLLMAHTGTSDGTSIVQYVPSTPETTILLGLYCLISRNLHQDMGIGELYRNHLSSLRYTAGHRPSKRTLRELYLLEDEVEIVASILSQQNDALKKLAKVFDSDSFRITDHVRINAFKRLEQPGFELLSAQYKDTEKEIKKLHDQIEKTAQVLRYNIEVAEEGDSKAVLVFTLVTIVFLPLSFVASLFGMNTSDMRNLSNNQSIFWAVALPLTAIIGGISLLVAYSGTQIRERFDDFREGMRESRSIRSRREKRNTAPSSRNPDEENVDGRAGMELLPAASTLKRRKTAKSAFGVSMKLAQRDAEKRAFATREKASTRRREAPRTRVVPRRNQEPSKTSLREMFY